MTTTSLPPAARPDTGPDTRPAADRRRRSAPQRATAWLTWGGFAVLLAAAPIVWSSSFAQTLLSQIGIAILACLAYNILLGQGGMLSFGHAVYSGLGGFVAIHALNRIAETGLALPVSLVPMVGGAAGLCFAALLGYVTTQKSGTTFAMITLGVGELVWSMSLMLPEFFGGEGGITGNRVLGRPVAGISFRPQIQVYYLIAVYCFLGTAAMYAFTRTPLGRMLNAVRDNPERVEFIGYSTQRVRYLAFMISGFFAGIAGGLGALNFELVTVEVVGAARSGAYLLFVYLGGATLFFGPILGAVLMVFALVMLSELTKAWLLYLGLVFVLMVIHAPGGLASLVMMNLQLAARGKLRRVAPAYLPLAAAGLLALAGVSSMIEMLYHLQLNAALGSRMRFLGLALDAASPASWAAGAAAAAAGSVLFEAARRRFVRRWAAVQQEMAAEARSAEAPA